MIFLCLTIVRYFCNAPVTNSNLKMITNIQKCIKNYNFVALWWMPYRSLLDVWSSSQAITLSVDQAAAVWGLAKSEPAWPKSSNRIMNGETGASTSGDWLDSSSGESVIKLDRDLSCLSKREKSSIGGNKWFNFLLPERTTQCCEISCDWI